MKNVRQRLLASTLLVGTVGVSTPAFAQQTPPEPPVNQTAPVTSQPDINAGTTDPGSSGQSTGAAVPAPQDIIITGSRIPRPDLTSTSPLAVVKSEEFKLSGSANVESVINNLPQVAPSFTAFSNNPGGGVALLNLRGLGTNRNLVLVNGRRWMFFDATQRVDVNTIPAFLIDSVDVVTGGASAVYGSDALAGVTNFHLRNDLEGALVGGTYAITQDGDGPRTDIYGAIGTRFADGRGNVTVYGEYYDRAAIFQNQRKFSQCTLGDTGDGGFVCKGSTTIPQDRVTVPSQLEIGPDASCGLEGEDPRNAGCHDIGIGTNFDADLGGAAFDTPGVSTPFADPADRFNFAPANYLMTPQKRWALGGYGEYEVMDGQHLYTELSFTNNKVVSQLAATPLTQNVNVPLTAPHGFCLNPGAAGQLSVADCATLTQISVNELAANAAAVAAGKALPFGSATAGTGSVPALTPGFVRVQSNFRITQVNNRINNDDRNAFRMLGGMRGDITSDWNYDVYYSYAHTRNAQRQLGNGTRSGFAANVQNGTCNIFGLNQLSQECISAITVNSTNLEDSTLEVANGSISGHLFTSPWADEAVGLALGLEYRRMEGSFDPDTFLASGDVVGFNPGQPTGGHYDAKEAFGELRVPLIEHNFIDRLELNGGFRYSKYSLSNVGGVWTYFAGVELSPIRDIMFRAQYQRAVRAPNISELFGGAAAGFPAASDPCANPDILPGGAAPDAGVVATCIASGVPSSSVGKKTLQPNAQIEGAFGGNPNLQEEIGDTWTAGAVLSPRFIPRLHASIDFYKIRVKGAIAPAGGGVSGILNLCFKVIQDVSNPICQLVHRDASGVLSGGGVFIVNAANANLGQLDTKGVDIQVDYALPVNFGLLSPHSKFSAYWFGNYQKDNSFIPVPGQPRVQCAGKFGFFGPCGAPTPKWKWTSRVAWADGPLTTSVRWRYIGKTNDDTPGGTDVDGFTTETLKPVNYFDLAFALNVTDNATMTFGINNLFDKRPQLIGSSQAEQANTFPSTYDPLGRDFFFSVDFKL
jgi:iron complex outermembrane recepter protein